MSSGLIEAAIWYLTRRGNFLGNAMTSFKYFKLYHWKVEHLDFMTPLTVLGWYRWLTITFWLSRLGLSWMHDSSFATIAYHLIVMVPGCPLGLHYCKNTGSITIPFIHPYIYHLLALQQKTDEIESSMLSKAGFNSFQNREKNNLPVLVF